MMKRRSFIGWGIFGVFASRVLKTESTVLAQNNSPTKFYPVGTLDRLESEGFLLNEDLDIGEVLVTKAKDNSLVAVNPTCTHAGCLVEWQKNENMLVCPCHQSQFQQDGTLIDGLAPIDLDKYKVKVENKIVFVSL